ncbi:alpha-tectorin-like [Synchiropus splendidus]|uniref:alpha-tectorin-like n=1 Tax=Synchiropus splendidus TaxID=270530 RepID=UPI00237EA6DF|nr:alpha-tectorin-like [Synchiropus splendidus]
MLWWLNLLAAAGLLADLGAESLEFTNFGVRNINSCPITYYGEKYDTIYVDFLGSKLSVCFKGRYKPATKNDCIMMSRGTASSGDLTVLTREIPTSSGVHKMFPDLKYPGRCVNVIPLADHAQSPIKQIELGNFGSQAILAIKTFSGYTNNWLMADTLVDGHSVDTHRFPRNDTSVGVIADMSGCRLSGFVYKSNTTLFDARICSTVSCDVDGNASAVSGCGPMENCDGAGSCFLNTVCTISASNVIDFSGQSHSAPDRCGYSLFQSPSLPNLQVWGVFKERWRADVSMLDHIIIHLVQEDVDITLEQGGRVLLGDTELTLSSAATVVHGVELYRNQFGVTAMAATADYDVSIFFDGNTAQINMEGPSGEPEIHGLCAEGNFVAEKVAALSESGCEIQHMEEDNSTIDCAAGTDWCNQLTRGPFTPCHRHVDPTPFVSICKDTLCSHPSVGNLKCQFMEAYSRACQLRGNFTVNNWRADTICVAAPEPFCPDKYCSSHEFCGERHSGDEKICLCRAIFASKYRPTRSFGEPTECERQSGQVNMARCLLEERSINFKTLHLNDQNCRGVLNKKTHMVTFGFNSSNACGTVVKTKGNQIIYKNSIMTRNVTAPGKIIRHNYLEVDFSCFLTQPDVQTWAIKVKENSAFHMLSAGEFDYSLTMTLYTDPQRKKPYQKDEDIGLDEKVWVELKTNGLDEKLISVVTENCWATAEPLSNATLRYDLIIHGCPNPDDWTVKTHGNGDGTSNYFSFDVFRFTGYDSAVFLHCIVELCVKSGNNCIPQCNHGNRERRSVDEPSYDPALITMALIH